MKTKLEPRGINISVSEVSSVGELGLWLLVDDREYFVPFADYPAFKKATIPQIFSVKRIGPRHLHWPSLDIDIELDALEHPEQFPLIYR